MHDHKIVRKRTSSARSHLVGQESRRKSLRSFAKLPGSIRIDSSPHHEHVAFVRDISPHGIFFYSDFKPTSGEPIAFLLQYRKGANVTALHISGCVVRVEQVSPSSAIGIAVEFDSEPQESPGAAGNGRLSQTRANGSSLVSTTKNTERLREVVIQERGARTPLFIQERPSREIPKVGAKFSVENRNFVVMEKKNVVLKHEKKTVRGVLLMVEDFDALSW